jgi:hypothetical protein
MGSPRKLCHAGRVIAFAVMVIIARVYLTLLQKTRQLPLALNQLAIFDRIMPAAGLRRIVVAFHARV